MKFLPLLALFLFTHVVADAQTVIDLVTDAASYAPRVAPGELATIFGSNLADSTQQAAGFPLPHSLAGATVYINQASVPLLYVSETQINFQVPGNLAAGTANMYVSRDGGQSAIFQFTVVGSSPGIFQDTSNHAIAQNPDSSTNSASAPVASGAVLVVYLTGQGALSTSVADGAATPNSPLSSATATATATIGGTSATVQFLVLTPGFTGLAQANILVPALATADYPLVITVGGYVSASAQISVSGSGTAPPQFLTLAGQLSFANGSASSVAVYGNTTYLCGPDRINIINTSNVSKPAYVGEFGDAQLLGNGGKCAINQNTSEPILVDIVGPNSAQASWTLAVYSLSVPDSPALLSQISTTYTFLTDISFLGTVGYFSTSWYTTSGDSISAQYGNFVAYDFSTLFPNLLGVLSSGSGSGGLNVMPNAVALVTGAGYPNTAYVTSTTSTGTSTSGSAALDVINISSPSSMQGVEQVTVASAAIFLGFGYDDSLLLVTGNTTSFRNPGVPDFSITGNLTLSTMNIANVQSPMGIANVTTQVPTTGTYVVQPLYIVPDVFAIVNNPPSTDPTGPSSLMIVDARTPSSPVLYPLQTEFGMSDIATAIVNSTTGYLLVPSVNGLMIYTIQTP
jgi:uncharacterized protein (TIGR03437 family)